jgi:3-oxoacyl-[acyl-carrier-protein] synthase-3
MFRLSWLIPRYYDEPALPLHPASAYATILVASFLMSFIRAFGSYLPSRVVKNEEIGWFIGRTPEWIVGVSGIEQRRFAAEYEDVATLATHAGECCLRSDHTPLKDIGLVIVTSGTAGRSFPGPAATVAEKLGLTRAAAVDLPMASAGSIFALAMARDLAPRYGNILVIGAEKMSTVALRQPINRSSAALFGDGAGACLVSARDGFLEIVDSSLHSDGTGSEDLRLGFISPLEMRGRSVIRNAGKKLPAAIREVLHHSDLNPKEVDAYLVHQANQHVIEAVARTLGTEKECFPQNIREYGNTSSASMLIVAEEYFRDRQVKSGRYFVFAAFGAGYHWGAVLTKSRKA